MKEKLQKIREDAIRQIEESGDLKSDRSHVVL